MTFGFYAKTLYSNMAEELFYTELLSIYKEQINFSERAAYFQKP